MRNIVFNDGMFCGVVRKHNSDSSPKSPAQKTEAELIAEAMADGELSVLTLGNSFSVDAMQYSYEIATDLGVEKVRLGNLYEPGCSILEHYNYANGNLSAFKQYNSDQMEMYNQIIAATKEKIVKNQSISMMIPTGTVIQNARTSSLGDTLTRDGYHLSFDIGRYIAGVSYMATLSGKDPSNLKYMPEGVNETHRQIAIDSVKKAIATSFAVTKVDL